MEIYIQWYIEEFCKLKMLIYVCSFFLESVKCATEGEPSSVTPFIVHLFFIAFWKKSLLHFLKRPPEKQLRKIPTMSILYPSYIL